MALLCARQFLCPGGFEFQRLRVSLMRDGGDQEHVGASLTNDSSPSFGSLPDRTHVAASSCPMSCVFQEQIPAVVNSTK